MRRATGTPPGSFRRQAPATSPRLRPLGTPARKPRGRAEDAHLRPSMTGIAGIPCTCRSGRCWARTSDLRLVETEPCGQDPARCGMTGHKLPANRRIHDYRTCTLRPSAAACRVRQMCEPYRQPSGRAARSRARQNRRPANAGPSSPSSRRSARLHSQVDAGRRRRSAPAQFRARIAAEPARIFCWTRSATPPIGSYTTPPAMSWTLALCASRSDQPAAMSSSRRVRVISPMSAARRRRSSAACR